MTQEHASGWKWGAWIGILAIVVCLIVAAWSRVWVLTAVPIGFLFGFFLQKGDLCGASAFSEVLVMKDRRKLAGLWILIVVAMAGFAILELLGWVKLSPKPFLYLNYIVGGVLFGVGMVLAGGCISGCLYKAATGNLNSIVALLTIPAGVMMVEFGPLHSMQTALMRFVIRSEDGGPVTLSTVTGLPYTALASIFAVATLALVILNNRRRPASKRQVSKDPLLKRVLVRPWKPWASGLAIGLLMVPAYLSSAASGRNYPLGITHGVMQAELLLIDQGFAHSWKPAPPASTAPAPPAIPAKPAKPVSWWLVLLCAALPLGAWVSARLNGSARLLPKPPDEILFALLGGFLTGVGAAVATGCVVGNIMSGWALMSVGMILFGLVTIVSNWLMTYIYLMGGQLARNS
jgi:uncharacterized membrane protein YedE/YeeE